MPQPGEVEYVHQQAPVPQALLPYHSLARRSRAKLKMGTQTFTDSLTHKPALLSTEVWSQFTVQQQHLAIHTVPPSEHAFAA